jgi:hypothetical protein
MVQVGREVGAKGTGRVLRTGLAEDCVFCLS